MKPSSFVDATDLDSWANRRDAQGALPQLVRRLIHATVSHVQRAQFPGGEGIQLGGWDGIVEVERGNEFVPDGLSTWELGSSKDKKAKADSDYEKRCKDPLGVDPLHSTFVFVTPRRWGAKDDWEAERRREGKWRNVRVYDADSIEQWLELAPAVHLWLSIRLGKHPEGVDDIDSFWDTWSAATQPATSPELMLAGRQHALEAIHEWLETPSTPLVIRAESPPEAVAVFASALQVLPQDTQLEIASRLVIVRNIASWNLLTTQGERLILVQDFQNATAHTRAQKHGHATVIFLGHADSISPNTIDVPRVSREEAAKALVAMDVPKERVGELAALAGRSLMALRRRIAVVPEIEQPEWARAENAGSLVPALLAGRWSDQTDGDREVIAKLAQSSYSDVSGKLVRWSNANDPPVRCVGATWYLTSEEDAWLLLARHVTLDCLNRFQEIALDVLGTPDPSFDLPRERRWMAGVYGHEPPHSGLLKTGLANTLAIMGARAESLETTGDIPLSTCPAVSVRRLLETQDWKVWASLPLPLLAEAAPDEFLGAVDRGLAGKQPTLAELFTDETDDMFSSPLHIDLLWALERVAWCKDYLVRATSSLGKLAKLDPGGRWANRPSQSLRTIFLPWMPRTTAPLEGRLAALDNLRRLVPEVAWKLMNALLPREMDHQDPAARPRWRDWAPEEDVRIGWLEYGETIHELVVRMIDDAGTNGGRWGDLVEAVTQLATGDYGTVVAKLEALNPDEMQPDDLALLSSSLRSLVSQHRSHLDAKWSLPATEVDRFAALLDRFEPVEPLHRFAWLFGSRIALPERGEEDREAYQTAVASRQCYAVETLHQQIRLDWLPEFIDKVEQPRLLGAAIARSKIGKDIEDQLLREYVRPDDVRCHDFLAGLVGERLRSPGLDWAHEKLTTLEREWSPAQRASFCVCLPFESPTWDLVHSLDEETVRIYWETASPFYVDGADVESAARSLLAHDRPYVAVDLLQHHVRGENLSPTLVLDALEQLVRTSPDEKDRRRLSAHHLADLLTFVSDAADVEESRVAALEWTLLPALGRHQYTPRLLHRELSRNPEFFAQVVGLVYRAEGEEPREQSKEEQARWTHAYELLRSWRWRPLPGMPEGGGLEPQALRTWVIEVRNILREDGRLSSGDRTIGEVLSAVPAGDDGVWPHPCLGDLIEEVESEDFEEGIFGGKVNSRGVVSWSMQDGGALEREEAKKYEAWASVVSRQWGRTAGILRRLGEYYRARAKEEDQRAEVREHLSD